MQDELARLAATARAQRDAKQVKKEDAVLQKQKERELDLIKAEEEKRLKEANLKLQEELKKKKLLTVEWNQFLKLVDSCKFWSTLPCEVLIGGNDGSQWILEGATNNYYQVMDKWSPREGAYYDCCNYLIELTDLKFKKNEKY
jgi:hypothetical protein